MPVYSYRCKICGHEFDVKLRFTDDRIQECPVCDGETRRVIHHVPVVFKGSGFYVTDNRNGKGPGSKSGKVKEDPDTKEKKTDQATASSDSKTSQSKTESVKSSN